MQVGASGIYSRERSGASEGTDRACDTAKANVTVHMLHMQVWDWQARFWSSCHALQVKAEMQEITSRAGPFFEIPLTIHLFLPS